ncbi:842_t:CDS:1 [Rhizophagus irregularis]|nr:Gis2p [Rhizophagus irregularis DAOM 197198w]CAG8590763.1 842_t:CDS:1 [Rhizophagus irregularis]
MDLGIRINQHKSIGTMWTRKYPYMGLLWQKRTNNEDLELSKTLEFMHLLGIDNVRGSIYSRPDLSFKERLEVYLNFNNKCSRCGRFGHSSNNCRCDICGEYGHLSYQCLNCYKCGGGPDHNFESCNKCYKCKSPYHYYWNCNNCYKCGGSGHFARECYM